MKITPKLVRVHKKSEKRDENREKKALAAARLEKAIKTELLDRLKKVNNNNNNNNNNDDDVLSLLLHCILSLPVYILFTFNYNH